MKNSIRIIFFMAVLISLISCSEDRVVLEKGAGFYEITKKEIITLDSLGNQTGVEHVENFGFISLFAKSGGASSGTWILNGETLTFPGERRFSSGWVVGPTDQNRLVMRKIFTLEGWGRKKVTLTHLIDLRTREVFYLTRN